MKYTTILFDLDGTLTDPAEGLTNSLRFAMEAMGMEPWSRQALLCFIGPPILDMCRDLLHMSPEDSQEFLRQFRVYFEDRGWQENLLFDGVADLLSALQSAGATLVVATSKPEDFALRILEHFGVAKYFTVIAGSTMDETRTKKGEVIAYALAQLPQADLSKTVMIGDRKHDIIGGQEHSLDTIGILVGYGDRPELEAAGATTIVETMADLKAYLLS